MNVLGYIVRPRPSSKILCKNKNKQKKPEKDKLAYDDMTGFLVFLCLLPGDPEPRSVVQAAVEMQGSPGLSFQSVGMMVTCHQEAGDNFFDRKCW